LTRVEHKLTRGDVEEGRGGSGHSPMSGGRTHPRAGVLGAAGFPSFPEDYLDRPLDFNELLIARPAATFAVRVPGDSMRDAGIMPGDIAVIDRSITPVSGCIVLA